MDNLERKDVDKFAHLASFEEVEKNDFNLNIPRYVDTSEPEPEVDLSAVSVQIAELDMEIKKGTDEILPLAQDIDKGDKTKHFTLFSSKSRFTDDTVMTVAVAETLLSVDRDAERDAVCDAVASAIFLARNGETKRDIRRYISEAYDYNLSRTLAEIRPTYCMDVTCQGSVPEAIIAFLEGNDFEDTVRGWQERF